MPFSFPFATTIMLVLFSNKNNITHPSPTPTNKQTNSFFWGFFLTLVVPLHKIQEDSCKYYLVNKVGVTETVMVIVHYLWYIIAVQYMPMYKTQ